MVFYRIFWLSITTVIVCTGCVLVPFCLAAGAAIAAAVLGFAAIAVAGCAIHAGAHEGELTGLRTAELTVAATVGAIATVATISLTAAFGGVVLGLVLIQAACCPPSLRRATLQSLLADDGSNRPDDAGRRSGGFAAVTQHLLSSGQQQIAAGTAQLDPPPKTLLTSLPAASAFGDLTVEQLCYWWRATYVMTQQAATPAQRLLVFGARRALLDLLAERNPDNFARWLESGARAASDPTRYFITPNLNLNLSGRNDDGATSPRKQLDGTSGLTD